MYIESGCNISHEYYLALLIDRETKWVLVMGSAEGGVDIEVAEKTPEVIHKIWADPLEGLANEDLVMFDELFDLEGKSKQEMMERVNSLYLCFR